MKIKKALLLLFISTFALAFAAFFATADISGGKAYAESGKDGNFSMTVGASVRTAEPYGIRFKANVSADLAEDESVTFGMTIIPFDWVERYSLDGDYIAELEQNELSFRKFVCTPVKNKDDDDYHIKASLTNLKENNIEREFIGIAYYEKDGVKTYAFDKNFARSIKTVATRALVSDAFENYTEPQKTFLRHSAKAVYCSGGGASITFERAIKGSDVIEFYYRKISNGAISFAVKDSANALSDQKYYGYYNIENDVSAYNGVVIEKAGSFYKVTI
ncbi:MAG: hypothetical protein J6U25_03000, partial [Clostridia bacterium]|nr:hypothetical protein [Clostridia bacterium]